MPGSNKAIAAVSAAERRVRRAVEEMTLGDKKYRAAEEWTRQLNRELSGLEWELGRIEREIKRKERERTETLPLGEMSILSRKFGVACETCGKRPKKQRLYYYSIYSDYDCRDCYIKKADERKTGGEPLVCSKCGKVERPSAWLGGPILISSGLRPLRSISPAVRQVMAKARKGEVTEATTLTHEGPEEIDTEEPSTETETVVEGPGKTLLAGIVAARKLCNRCGGMDLRGIQHLLFIEGIHIGDVSEIASSGSIDLTEMGYDKLLGRGSIDRALEITVREASARAIEKVEAAGGSVTFRTSLRPVFCGRRRESQPLSALRRQPRHRWPSREVECLCCKGHCKGIPIFKSEALTDYGEVICLFCKDSEEIAKKHLKTINDEIESELELLRSEKELAREKAARTKSKIGNAEKKQLSCYKATQKLKAEKKEAEKEVAKAKAEAAAKAKAKKKEAEAKAEATAKARLATKRRERLGLSPTATEDECLAAEKEVAKAKAEREARIAKEEEKLKKKEQAKQLRKEKSEIKFFSEMFETVGVGTQKWAEVRLLPDSISGKKSRDGERPDMKRSKMNTHIIEAYVAGMLTKEIATRLDLFLKDLVIPGITRRNAAELAVEVGKRKHLKMVLTYEHWRSAKEAGLRTEPSKTKAISEVMPRGADWVDGYKKWMSDRPHFIDLKQGREMFEGPRLENMAKVKRMGNLYSAILVLEELGILSFFVEEPPEVVSAFSDILRDESGAWGGPRDEERMKLVRKYAEGAWEGDRIKNLVLVHSVLDEENAELLSELLEGHDLTHTLHKFGKMN